VESAKPRGTGRSAAGCASHRMPPDERATLPAVGEDTQGFHQRRAGHMAEIVPPPQVPAKVDRTRDLHPEQLGCQDQASRTSTEPARGRRHREDERTIRGSPAVRRFRRHRGAPMRAPRDRSRPIRGTGLLMTMTSVPVATNSGLRPRPSRAHRKARSRTFHIARRFHCGRQPAETSRAARFTASV
jgi:hypothetical protein